MKPTDTHYFTGDARVPANRHELTGYELFYDRGNKRIPGAAALMRIDGVDLAIAKEIRSILNGERNLRDYGPVQKLYNMPEGWHTYGPMLAISTLFGYGVEYVKSADDGYRVGDQYGVDYINMGDPYVSTLCYDCKTDTWSVGCWGNWVEMYPRRFADD